MSKQSPLVKAYFELVDASGLSDEEFEALVEAQTPGKHNAEPAVRDDNGNLIDGQFDADYTPPKSSEAASAS